MRQQLIAVTCALLALATSYCMRAAAGNLQPSAAVQPEPHILEHAGSQLEVNAGNYGAVAAAVASEQRQILVTTVEISYGGRSNSSYVLEIFKNFACSLARVDRLRNTLTVSYSARTCELLQSEAIPCFVDRAGPDPSKLPGIHKPSAPTYQKYWHALELTRLNYTVLVLDSDLSVVKDPFHFHDARFDIEGLSDWNSFAQVPGPEHLLEEGCHIYKMVQQEQRGNASLQTAWYVEERKPWAAVKHLSPCMSTGLFFLEPRDATIAFLKGITTHMLVHHIWQWEQAAFNEVVMAYLIGVEDRQPLAFRILPTRHFLNVKASALRRQLGLEVDVVVIHAGGVGSKGKGTHLQREGYWDPEDWKPQLGMPLMAKYEKVTSD